MVGALLGGGIAPASAAAPALKACKGQKAFGCGTLTVPLDRSGATHGEVTLAIAAQKRFPKGAGLLVALSGGPGQSSVDAASEFATSLKPLLKRYRLVTIDQRGTGPRGALECPALQRLSSLAAISPRLVLTCEQLIGPQRSFYGTRDSVADLEALRIAFGAKKLALMGVSYGTYVAQQYARTYPDNVDRLLLDSIVGPGAPDAFYLDTYSRLPRVLREQCARRACRTATKDPVADLARVTARLREKSITGPVYDTFGRAHTARYLDEGELAFLVTSGDLNPYMQARLPGAMAAAAAGDDAALLRLRRIGEGPSTNSRDLSYALNVTTSCLDVALPYALTDAPAERETLGAAAAAAIPPASYAPWSLASVTSSSYVDDCLLFPRQTSTPPPLGPLPDVPALLLAGRLDMRTPVENAERVKALLPHAALVEVGGNGHDQLDTDATGCAERALTRWAAGRPVGNPCRGKSNEVAPFPRPPLRLADVPAGGGVSGPAGRAVVAAVESVTDARVSALEAVFGGFDARGGGLRGGSYRASDAFDGTLRLRGYSYVPGLRVSGKLFLNGPEITGTVTLAGAASGRLTLNGRGGAAGVVSGYAVRYRGSGTRRVARAASQAVAAALRARQLR